MVERERSGQQWEGILLDPREEVHLEIKSWLDPSDNNDAANLAKAMLALANTGGGQVLIGYEEVAEEWNPAADQPGLVSKFDQDTINGIVEKFADPQFHCNVYHVEHPDLHTNFRLLMSPVIRKSRFEQAVEDQMATMLKTIGTIFAVLVLRARHQKQHVSGTSLFEDVYWLRERIW